MKFRSARLGSAQSLVALSVSFAVVISTQTFAFASFANFRAGAPAAKSTASQKQTAAAPNELRLTSLSATATATGVLLEWHTNSTSDNLGFNVYRLKDGQRTRVNREIIPGAAFVANAAALMRGGYSYAWFDRGGTADSVYYIESVSLQGTARMHEAVAPVVSKNALEAAQTNEARAGESAGATESADMFEKYYPAAESQQPNLPNGTLEDQWAIAAQSGLKIAIRKDGWYRVTQPQMAAAGFNPAVNIRNLRLFGDGKEVAISTSQSSGQFGSGDYIEFYGRGLETPTTDVRTYYLIAGTTPGKRVIGEIQGTGDPGAPPPPKSTPTPAAPPVGPIPPSAGPVLRDPIFFSWVQRDMSEWIESLKPSNAPAALEPNARVESLRIENSTADNSQAGGVSPVVNDGGSVKLDNAPPVVNSDPIVKNGAVAKSDAVAIPTTRDSDKTKPTVANAIRAGQFRKGRASKKRKRNKLRRAFRVERNHAETSGEIAPDNFDYTVERKDRLVYLSNLLNGDAENFFGQVIAGSPVTQTLTVSNPDLSAVGPASLEVALQGVQNQFGAPHSVDVSFNNVPVGSLNNFGALDHPVQTFAIPISLLQSGSNSIKFTKTSTGELCIVDYVRLTYPHLFSADQATGNIHLASQPNSDDTLIVGDRTYTFKTSPTTDLHIGIGVNQAATATNIANRINSDTAFTHCSALAALSDVALTGNPGAGNSITLTVDGVRLTKTAFANGDRLKFSLRGTQSRKVDGFASPLVRLIDYTDPFNVIVAKPDVQASISGFVFTVPTSQPLSKTSRLLYGIAQNQFDQPASLSLNQPSTLNLNSNQADFLIVSHKNFIPSFNALVPPGNTTSFVAQKLSQGLKVSIVDIEDVYDEFSYGVHGPQAIRDFLQYAATHWNNAAVAPRYVVFAGDASLDPRNYQGAGNFDFVPTKLVDATYNETASDDWLTDFDNDGIANIPVGRLPFRTVAEADLVIKKIVNFSPANVPSNALLVADQDDQFHSFQFVEANDAIQAQLPASMTVQRVNRGTAGLSDSQARADILAGLNAGRAAVNYSGHGNVDVWTGASIFTASDARTLTNGNKLSFVVVMDCLNGYFQDPNLESMAEAFLKAQAGGAVAGFASSGLTIAQGQHVMSQELFHQLYGNPQSPPLGDAIKIAKAATFDYDVRRTWIFFGDPSMKIR